MRRVEAVGWDGDALEAQAFAYLAARSLAGLPLSLPSTTGVPRPMRGGRLFPFAARTGSEPENQDERQQHRDPRGQRQSVDDNALTRGERL